MSNELAAVVITSSKDIDNGDILFFFSVQSAANYARRYGGRVMLESEWMREDTPTQTVAQQRQAVADSAWAASEAEYRRDCIDAARRAIKRLPSEE